MQKRQSYLARILEQNASLTRQVAALRNLLQRARFNVDTSYFNPELAQEIDLCLAQPAPEKEKL